MNFTEYQQKAVATAIYTDSVVYPALGLGSEAGEVLGKIKKVLRDNGGEFSPETIAALSAELGDVLWYIAALSRDLGLNLDQIARENIEKLERRSALGLLGGSGDNR